MNGSDRGQQCRGRRVLDQKTAGANLQRLEHVLIVFEFA
jgi:hypothetical protein